MIKSIVSIFMTVITLMTSLFYTGLNNESVEKEFSIISQGEIVGNLKGNTDSDNNYFDIVFDDYVQFDTVVLKEKNNNITSFSISIKDKNGQFQKIYEQERIGEYRYCALDETITDTVRITIHSSIDNKYKIKNVDILNVSENKKEDFRVTSYLVCQWFYGNNFEISKINIITDIILFGVARFDENGNVYLQDLNINGVEVSGDKVFRDIIEDIRKANPDIKIHCNVLGPDGANSDDKEKLHSQAFTDNGDILIENFLNLLETYDFDGLFFDYEYPHKLKSINDYSNFLVELDKYMDDYILGAAFSHWSSNISWAAIQVLDRVEIMSYDNMTEINRHAEFATVGGAIAIEDFEKRGYDLSKCDLGLPFYGRTHGGEEAWPSYAQIAPDITSPFENFVNKSYLNGGTYGDELLTSFNGVQMIKDKTAFANDYGLGGVMVWHYTCDVHYESDLSLFKAIQSSLGSRN